MTNLEEQIVNILHYCVSFFNHQDFLRLILQRYDLYFQYEIKVGGNTFKPEFLVTRSLLKRPR